MNDKADSGQDLARDFDKKVTVAARQPQTVAAEPATAAQAVSPSAQSNKRARPDAGDSDVVLPAQKRLRDEFAGGVSDADLNKLYDKLVKTNPEFARREAAAVEAAGNRRNTIDERTNDRSRSTGREL